MLVGPLMLATGFNSRTTDLNKPSITLTFLRFYSRIHNGTIENLKLSRQILSNLVIHIQKPEKSNVFLLDNIFIFQETCHIRQLIGDIFLVKYEDT
jgi:hypothetical protein